MNDSKKRKFCEYSKDKLSLVGYSGEMKYDRRLLPLHKTTKYTRWLELEEHARHDKVQ